MSATLTRQVGVPREYLGEARAQRNKLVVADNAATAMIERIVAPIQARTVKGSIPRTELLVKAAQLWREILDGFGRLSFDIEQAKGKLIIHELRVSAADFCLTGWPLTDVEPGFAIVLIGFSLQRRSCRLNQETLASLSLHSLARWYQRNLDTTQTTLKSDLAKLAAAISTLDLTPDSKFSVSVSGGRWVGVVREICDDELLQKVLSVRTFLTD